jgi:hypothetical protein
MKFVIQRVDVMSAPMSEVFSIVYPSVVVFERRAK